MGDEHVVGSNAGLTTVESLTPQDTVGSDGEVGALVDVDGRLASKLEGGRAEPLGSLLSNDAADGSVTCIEDVLVSLVKSSSGLGMAPLMMR